MKFALFVRVGNIYIEIYVCVSDTINKTEKMKLGRSIAVFLFHSHDFYGQCEFQISYFSSAKTVAKLIFCYNCNNKSIEEGTTRIIKKE